MGQIHAQISAAKLAPTVTLAGHLFPKPQLLNQKMGEQVTGVRFPRRDPHTARGFGREEQGWYLMLYQLIIPSHRVTEKVCWWPRSFLSV